MKKRTYKRMKNLVMRVKSLEQRQISVSCPFFTSTKSIDKFVVSNLPSLLKRTKKHQEKGKESCVITEIPYEVIKQQLVKKIDDIRINNNVSGIAEVRDESDKDAFCRIVIEFKPGANKELVMKIQTD